MKTCICSVVIFAIFFACNSAPHSQSIDEFEDDIPVPVSTSVKPAGEETPDIVRFLKVQEAVNPQLSPDGRFVAYRTRVTGIPQIWVTAASRLSAPQQITYGNSVTFHAWSPSGKYILYGKDTEGDEREGYYLITPDGLTGKEILAPSDAFRFFGGFNQDGSQFTYSSTNRNGRDFDIYIYDIPTETSTRVYLGKLGYIPVSISPDGSHILITERIGEDANIPYLLNVADSTLSQLANPDEPSIYSNFHWKSDGSGFYLRTNHNRDNTGVAYYDIATLHLSYLVSSEHEIDQVLMSADEQRVHWIANERGYSQHYMLDLSSKAIQEGPNWPPGVLQLVAADQHNTLAAYVQSPNISGDIWTWTREQKTPLRVTRSPLGGIDFAECILPTIQQFQTRDGLTVEGLLYYPTLETEQTPPLVLQVHGGPTSQSRPEFDALTQYLIQMGFAVFQLNYRGSTGYGKSFARLNNQRQREDELIDLEDAVTFLVSEGYAEPTQIAIMGVSYGGYLTMAAMTRLPSLFTCGVASVGVSNWITALEGAHPFLKASDRFEYGDITDPADRAFFRSISPIQYVENIAAPIMVLHGANDPRDPVAESDDFVRQIRAQGGQVQYLRFPDEGHGIRKMENRITAYTRVAEFLERNLGMD